MSKYLLQANYKAEGVKGLLAEGGSSRVAAVKKALKSAGGKLESFYFAFGESDVYLICDVPDNATMAAIALNIATSGTVHIKTTVLLTAEELDAAAQTKAPSYRAPGQ
jgi:uncharacterized protein with GYD domain